jgi:UDPglucose--hexose-1-phosphate uridylyltransferase
VFKKHEEKTRIILPGKTRPVTIMTEVRIDPLTGRSVRITRRRSNDPPIDFANPPYRGHVEASKSSCPFCPGRIMDATPRFDPEIAPEGRFTFGESILFPNTSPYGPHSGVSTFSPAHFIEIGEFSEPHYRDTFINARRYIDRVLAVDPDVRYAAVTQNYLPSSGGTLIHPHLQINLFVTPTNYLRELATCSEAFLKETGRPFWDELVGREEASGERFIARTDGIVWLCPFAPAGQKEVWAIFEGRSDFRELSDKELSVLARGILSVQRYWRDEGNNGFNLGIYSIAGLAKSYRMLMRMVVRTRFVPYARNDQSYFEVILGESATDEFPEKIAADIRKYFE